MKRLILAAAISVASVSAAAPAVASAAPVPAAAVQAAPAVQRGQIFCAMPDFCSYWWNVPGAAFWLVRWNSPLR
jgi:hypothetical protein